MLDDRWCRLCKKWMALYLRQRGGLSRDVRKARILGRRSLFEIGELCDSNLLGEAQKFPVAGTNVVDAMAVIGKCKAPTQSQEFLPAIMLGIEISRLCWLSMTDLAYLLIRIWLLQPFSQRCRVELQDASIVDNEDEIPVDSLPNAFQCFETDIRVLTLQPD